MGLLDDEIDRVLESLAETMSEDFYRRHKYALSRLFFAIQTARLEESGKMREMEQRAREKHERARAQSG